MDRLRRRQRPLFSGFTTAEIEKMERLLKESDQRLDKEFFQKVARRFSSSAARAGKPVVKWTEVQSWFRTRQQDCLSKVASSTDASNHDSPLPESNLFNKTKESSRIPEGETIPDLSELKFEARSSKDGAWYDVDMFLSHRILASGDAEVRVRFVGFGAEEDEWVNVKNAVRERSVPLEHSECHKLKVGDLVCCFQERRDQAQYFDAHIVDVQRKTHDIRGCRCLFLVRYDHDNTEARKSPFEEVMLQADIIDLL
ncbi:hypothetical protein NC651_038325 [Populus alba x Populus x berolinensis]|nr:hypothetical protein NC651_038325 [Populus alba x Populus x berolinensis]